MTEQMQRRYDSFIADFEEVVSIDSSSDNLEGVAKVAAFFEKRFKALGLDVEIVRAGEQGVPCLKACTPSKEGRYDFMMLGHMDTVFPPGEIEKRPFTIKDGKAWGPGVCDMKAGLLTVLHVLELLNERGQLDALSFCVTFNGDEETGSNNSRPFIEECAALCDRVFVFEPCRPGYRHVLQRKGGGWFTVIAHGIAAHAGADPDKGANAVIELAHQAIRINELNRKDSGISAQCTVISGGDKVNILPDRAVMSVDTRVSTMEEMEYLRTFMASLSETIHVEGCTVEVLGDVNRPPLVPTTDSKELWNILQEEGKALGISPEYIATGGCSDGNFTSALGVPTIDGMGSVGANSHREDEYVELDSIIPTIQMVASTCARAVASPKA